MTAKAERQIAIQRIRQDNERNFGPPAREAVGQMLHAALHSPWMYVYELTQNALDAGAKRVWWRLDGDHVFFQHDGCKELNERHIRGLASVGASTKGLDAIGFMGIGFKSVFARYREARVAGSGWRFRFTVPVESGSFGSTVPNWFETLLPAWDDDAPLPDEGFSTAFLFRQPHDPARTAHEDLQRLAAPQDPTPLAVLALRGLRQLRIGDETWDLTHYDGIISLRYPERDVGRRWKALVSTYRPNDAAMRNLLEVRRKILVQANDRSLRAERQVVALLPLDDDGLPHPPDTGRVYSTLPTRAPLPFGFHLQADWLVSIGRQEIREVEGNPWQEAIVRQVPDLVHQLLSWLAQGPAARRSSGYRALCEPREGEGPLGEPLRALREDFISTLAGAAVVPIHGAGSGQFRTPDQVAKLPAPFRDTFGSRWRPDLLFGLDLMDETLLGKRATGFARWLGWGREIEEDDVGWAETVPRWWGALSQDEQTEALFALWQGISDSGWDDAPVVPTEAGAWRRAADTVWLNEAPPSAKEPGGAAVLAALADQLPSANERLPSRLRQAVNQADGEGPSWFSWRRHDRMLSAVIREVCESVRGAADLPLVPLVQWALYRGDRRRDLVPRVLTEEGARKPSEALLADPLVAGGRNRRLLFPKLPALVPEYAALENVEAVVRFLEQLGVHGGVALKNQEVARFRDTEQAEVAELIGVATSDVEFARRSDGYRVVNPDFPFNVEDVPAEALQDWLSRGHVALKGRGRWQAFSHWYVNVTTTGQRLATWVESLQSQPWLLCTDGQRRTPTETVLEADPDFEDAPIADITEDLASRLTAEGLRFGADVPKSPVLRRLKLRRGTDLPDSELAALLQEARAHIEAGEATEEELLHALEAVKVRGVPLMGRVVQQTGSGGKLRSDLSWVVALSILEPPLADAIADLPLDIPQTTTGQQALDFLLDVWNDRPSGVEALRGRLAAAYRYVLEDLESGLIRAEDWQRARAGAQFYGGRTWHPASPGLAVDDVGSPLIHQFLPEHRITVAATHLGETTDEVRRIARALGLGLLSDDVSVQSGPRTGSPPRDGQLWRLLDTLAGLEHRRSIKKVVFVAALRVHVSGRTNTIHAYVENATLKLAGEPRTFGVEAAGQLVEYFRLGQRGNAVPWLTGALFSLGDREEFARSLQVLADGLGIDVATARTPDDDELTRRAPKDEPGVNPPRVRVDPPGSDPPLEAGTEKGSVPPGDQPDRPSTQENGHHTDLDTDGGRENVPPVKPPLRAPRAADHFGIVVARKVKEEQDASSTRSDRGGTFRDDHKARRAVIQYETHCGRRAEAMDDLQPGFDVRSTDEATGHERRIEVKGVQGTFQDDASVVLTPRQARDAVTHVKDSVEYWLYVVDSTETDHPRVFPIPWVRRRPRYGFYAKVWATAAERPAVVTEEGLTDLSAKAFET
ncbi:MAG: DUF3883 domain-containing protein [Acidobacteria bacterium]|nr:DUF3883 domain-containing protein [Acidobacteriota bacterium]MYE94184.1 DUF3883 domain-containing protein [Gemmatimonadota bacterium]MYI96620.1 DUF3883 domain-containing protein [Acidobacteriota bacterium]